MKNAIKKAIEGGYDIEAGYRQEKTVGDRDRFALLDPLFWQCLGKQQGWGCDCDNGHEFQGYESIYEEDGSVSQGDPIWGGCRNCVSEGKYYPKEDWKDYMHKFINHLIEGKGIDEFFNSLIK